MAYIVNISKETIQILNAFASTVGDLFYMEPGNTVRAIGQGLGSNIAVKATIEETFPKYFKVFKLSEFLSTIELPHMTGAHLEFTDSSNEIAIVSGNNVIRYRCTDADIKEWPKAPDGTHRNINVPDEVLKVEFTLTADIYNGIIRAKSLLKHNELMITVKNGKVVLIADDTRSGGTANKAEYIVGESESEGYKEIIQLDSDGGTAFHLMKGDYAVRVGGGRVHFRNLDREIEFLYACKVN